MLEHMFSDSPYTPARSWRKGREGERQQLMPSSDGIWLAFVEVSEALLLLAAFAILRQVEREHIGENQGVIFSQRCLHAIGVGQGNPAF